MLFSSYVGAVVISSGIQNLVSIIVFFFFGYFVLNISYPLTSIPVLCFLLFISWLSLLGLGVLIATYSNTIQQAVMLANVVTYLLVFAAPVYYDATILPEYISFLSMFIPLTYSVIAINLAMTKEMNDLLVDQSFLPSIAALVFLTCICLIIGFKGIRWREK